MLIAESMLLLRQHIRRLHQEGKRIVLVPTMGNLHDGHMKLVDEAKASADVVVVSIFVDPMQFGHTDDLAHYPRTLQNDYEKPSKRHIDFVFAPVPVEAYPQGTEDQTYIDVPGLSTMLGGTSRPGHFRGMPAIVSKLFNLIQPDVTCLDEEDFRQLALTRKIVANMGYDIKIIGVPIVRTKDGLALSSHNGYLTADQCKITPDLYRVLSAVTKRLATSDHQLDEIVAIAKQELNEKGSRADDIQVHDADTLLELADASQRAVILMAAWLGQAYLINNQIVTLGQ